MSPDILAREPTAEERDMLADMMQAMPPTYVDRVMHWSKHTTQGAIDRGEMRCIKLPDSKRQKVTPSMVAEWIANYCTYRGKERAS